MEYSNKFIELIREICRFRKQGVLWNDNLAKAMLAQSIIESGRGTSELALKHNNFWAMKYREELRDLAKKEYVKVTSEQSGGAYFCSFDTVVDGVKGYLKFIERSPYDGWKNHVGTWESFLQFIGPIWCPPGYTDRYKKNHYGLTYDQYIIQKLGPEAGDLMDEYSYTPPEERGTWLEFFRDPKGNTVVTAADGDGKTVALLNSNNKTDVSQFLAKFPEANSVRVAPAGKEIPYLPGYTRGKEPVEKDLVLIDPGHSELHPGAKSKYDSRIQEEDLNRAQADLLFREWSKGSVIAPEIYDPRDDDLEDIGYRAKGKAAFISLHHNSAEGITRDAGVEVFVDKDKGSDVSFELATILSARIAAALGLRDRGAKRANLTVIDRAERVCNGPCVLVETNFINIAKDYEEQVQKSIKAAKVIAETVEEWIRNKAQKTS